MADKPDPGVWVFHHRSKCCSSKETKCIWKINAWKVNASSCSFSEDARICWGNGQLLKCAYPLRCCVTETANILNQEKGKAGFIHVPPTAERSDTG